MVLAVCTIYRSQVNATSPTTSTVVAVPACTSTDGQTWPSKECCSRQLVRRRRCRAAAAPAALATLATLVTLVTPSAAPPAAGRDAAPHVMIPRRLLAVEALPLTGDYHLLEVLPKGRDYHLLEAPPGTTTTVNATPTSTVAATVAEIPLTGDHHLLEAPPGNTTTVNTTTANATSPTTSTAVAAPACTSTDGQTWPSKECCSRQLARRRHCRAAVAPTGMGAVTTGSLGAAAARRGGDPN